jgi:flotillin
MDHLAETAATAISNIKFDKIVVWDGANGSGGGPGGAPGGSGTSRFLQSLAGSLPPTLQMMRDIGGVEMPEFLGKLVPDDLPEAASVEEVALTASGDTTDSDELKDPSTEPVKDDSDSA